MREGCDVMPLLPVVQKALCSWPVSRNLPQHEFEEDHKDVIPLAVLDTQAIQELAVAMQL